MECRHAYLCVELLPVLHDGCTLFNSYYFLAKDTGMLVGLNGVFGTLAGILSPVLAGWVIDVSGGQYEYALYLGAGVAIVGAFFMLIARIRPIEKKSARVSAGGRKGFAG